LCRGGWPARRHISRGEGFAYLNKEIESFEDVEAGKKILAKKRCAGINPKERLEKKKSSWGKEKGGYR